MNNQEEHLDVYPSRFEFYNDRNEKQIFEQGPQNIETQQRYAQIKNALAHNFLNGLFEEITTTDFSALDNHSKFLIHDLVEGITSEVGRTLVGVTVLQLAIKSIAPEQNIRLHKGGARRGSFSWENGISMRTFDSNYVTPFLREKDLLKVNKFGVFMTRSLAENYPYTKLYKADMKGPFKEWIVIVDAIENNEMNPKLSLKYLLKVLKEKSDNFQNMVLDALNNPLLMNETNLTVVKNKLQSFFNSTSYSARAFEVVIHSLYQALDDIGLLELELVPLSQMRSANKKHGNVGDIELKMNNIIVESWEAKYRKPYLRDELEELKDKIEFAPGIEIAGFIVDSEPDLRTDILSRVEEIETLENVKIPILSFNSWFSQQTDGLTESQKRELGKAWVKATIESFGQRRSNIAPIDEPCEVWFMDLVQNLL